MKLTNENKNPDTITMITTDKRAKSHNTKWLFYKLLKIIIRQKKKGGVIDE